MREADHFGVDYIRWKEWGHDHPFGQFDFLTPYYFDAEIRKTGLADI